MGSASGLGWLPDGSMLVVSMRDQRILRRSRDGTVTVQADLSGAATGNLNDMVVGAAGQDFALQVRGMAGEHQVETMGYTYPIADIVYLWFDSANIGSGLNLSHTDDPDLDALISKSRTTMDPDERNAVFEDLQKYVVDHAIWAPLWIDNYTWAYDKSIQGAQVHPDAYTMYFDAWLS